METRTQRLASLLIPLGLGLFCFSGAANAQPPLIQSAREEMKTAVLDAQAVSPHDAVNQALAKKEAFIKIVTFSRLEGKQLIDALMGLQKQEERPEFSRLLDTLLLTLTNATTHFTVVLGALGEDETIHVAEIEDMAAAFREWRKLKYDPLIREAVELTLVARVGEALATADARFTKITAAARKIAFGELSAPLETLLGRASLEIRNARRAHQKAEVVLLAYLPPEPHTDEPAAVLGAEGRSTPQRELASKISARIREPSDIQSLAQAALTYLRSAYDEFIEMNRLVTDFTAAWTKKAATQ